MSIFVVEDSFSYVELLRDERFRNALTDFGNRDGLIRWID